jgi:hypothetical protein
MAEKLLDYDRPDVRQMRDPDEFEAQEWFTNTSNAEYLE